MSRVSRFISAVAIFIAAFFVRYYNIDLRPLQFDEGVNYGLISSLLSGKSLNYNPSNFHGPLLFYFNAYLIDNFNFIKDCSSVIAAPASRLCLALSEANFRTGSILFGSLLTILPFAVFSIGTTIATGVSLLLCFSPSLIFLSQQNIHEIYFTFFSTLFLITFWNCFNRKHIFNFWIAAASLGLMIATKETWIITVFVAFVLTGIFLRTKLSLLMFNWIKIGIFSLLIASAFYINFQAPFQAISQIANGILNWSKIAITSTHQSKPFNFYLKTILQAEAGYYCLLVLLFISFLIKNFINFKLSAIKDQNNLVQPQHLRIIDKYNSIEFFLISASIVLIIIYSSFTYKTPWLIITMITPGIIGAGIILFKYSSGFLISITLIVLSAFNLHLFMNNNPALSHPLQPIPSYHGVRDLGQTAQNICASKTDCRILVIAKEYWPIPFYLQNYKRLTSYVFSRTEVEQSYIDKFDVVIQEMSPFKQNDSQTKTFVINGRLKVEILPVSADKYSQ